MRMTYPINFRKKVLNIKEKEELSFAEVAKRFGLCKTTVFKWSKKLEPQRNRNRKATKIDPEILKKDIEQYPDSYCYERAQRLGVVLRASGMPNIVWELAIKKNLNHPKADPVKKYCLLKLNKLFGA